MPGSSRYLGKPSWRRRTSGHGLSLGNEGIDGFLKGECIRIVIADDALGIDDEGCRPTSDAPPECNWAVRSTIPERSPINPNSFRTALAFSRSSSPLTPTRTNGRPFIRLTRAFPSGTLVIQGAHHVAQNEMRTTLPRKSESFIDLPSTSSTSISGTVQPMSRFRNRNNIPPASSPKVVEPSPIGRIAANSLIVRS